MRSLNARLARLERAQAKSVKRTRCADCRDWPDARIHNIDTDGVETWQDPDMPTSCPTCGWTPELVTIQEVKDWERVGKYGIR